MSKVDSERAANPLSAHVLDLGATSSGREPGSESPSVLLTCSGNEYSERLDAPDDLERQYVVDQQFRRRKLKLSGWPLLWLTYQSLGAVFGDIGTSPLYVFSSTFTSTPSQADIVGALSIILWTLTLVVTIKYVLIVMRADDDGEGGVFALYSLLARSCNLSTGDKIQSRNLAMQRYATGDLRPPNRRIRKIMEQSPFFRHLFRGFGIVGVALLMADGVLTPAQSVLGAIQGIRVVRPDLGSQVIVGATCAILVLLFVLQPFGLTRLSSSFAPIIIVWLLFNFSCAAYNLARHDMSVLKAFSPHYAFAYLLRNGHEGWKSLGGLMLCITGAEVMFADLGAFGSTAISLSWLCITYPCLLMAYIGQAAYLSGTTDPEAWSNSFFSSLPPGTFYPGLVISILAAVVASQATITGAFQLLVQVMNLSYFPRLPVHHTSKLVHSQVYISLANWVLMLGTVIITAVYNNTTSLGNAYGVCVIVGMFLTTIMTSFVAIIVWRVNVVIVVVVFLVFAALDGAYVSATLVKVPQGGWLTIVVTLVLALIFFSWHSFKGYQLRVESNQSRDPNQVIRQDDHSKTHLVDQSGSPEHELGQVSGVAVFYDKEMIKYPLALLEYFKKFRTRHDVIVLLNLRPQSIPTIPEEDRITVLDTWLPNCYRVIVRFGYTENISLNWDTQVRESVLAFVNNKEGDTRMLSEAFDSHIVYFKPRKNMLLNPSHGWLKRRVIWLYSMVDSMTAEDQLNVSADKMVEFSYNCQY